MLSGVRMLISGAEPVRASTLRGFAARFEGCSLSLLAFSPSYGMAETCLMAASRRGRMVRPTIIRVHSASLTMGERVRLAAADERNAREVVGNGFPVHGADIRAVDPVSSLPMPEAVPARFGRAESIPAVAFGMVIPLPNPTKHINPKKLRLEPYPT